MSTIDTLPNSASNTHPLDLSPKQIGIAVLRLVGRTLVAIARVVYQWQEHSSEKRALQDMDARMLSDLGLSRSDVERAFDSTWHRLGR